MELGLDLDFSLEPLRALESLLWFQVLLATLRPETLLLYKIALVPALVI